jgi:hypothetical protein
MAVKGNLSQGLVSLAAATTDTTLVQPSIAVNRLAVTAAILSNTESANREVELYESPNLTSASGTLVATYVLAAEETALIEEIIGQAYESGQNIIAVQTTGGASAGDVVARVTYTTYDGES